jgi:hypothetical protein
MPLNFYGSQTVTPTNAMVAQETYSDPLATIFIVRPTFAKQTSWKILCLHIPLIHIVRRLYHLEVLCYLSVLSRTRCLTDMCKDGKTGKDRSDRPIKPVRLVHLNRSDQSYQPVRPVPPIIQFQTSRLPLHPHSQILQVILIKCLLNIRMIWLICLEKILE